MATRLAVCCFKSPLTAPPRAFCIATHSLFSSTQAQKYSPGDKPEVEITMDVFR